MCTQQHGAVQRPPSLPPSRADMQSNGRSAMGGDRGDREDNRLGRLGGQQARQPGSVGQAGLQAGGDRSDDKPGAIGVTAGSRRSVTA